MVESVGCCGDEVLAKGGLHLFLERKRIAST